MWQYGDHQIHITADVIVGMWHYVQATGDDAFLFDCGAEMIVETARYWAERVDTVKGRPGHHIYGVMGPDEYKPLTNNNAYTNFTARFNLRLAGDVVRLMTAKAPDKLAALRAKTGLTDDELAEFESVANDIAIPLDASRNIVWQCDDFDTAFVDLDIDAIWKDKTVLFGKYVSQEKLFRSKTLKQSDVIALMAVFPTAFSREQITASFDYYKPLNIHDSSNSMCHHMMVAAEIGRPDEAYAAWLRSLDIDFAALPRASDGVHCANVGGMWQEVVFGFAGMRSALCASELTFNPCLPVQVKRIAFRIQWKGAPVRVTLTPSSLHLENGSDIALAFHVHGTRHEVAPRAQSSVPLVPVSPTR
jgi:kojibiose phosphorylase